MQLDWEPLRRLIAAHHTFVITSHVRPDADAIGSEIGLAEVLTALGKSVRIINVSATPPHLGFLDPDRLVHQLGVSATPDDVTSCDAQIVVDTSAWNQLTDIGKLFREVPKPRAVIDHHVSSDDLQAAELKDTTREATGALIFELAETLGITLSARAASALFAAIATDTGWFRFPATSAQTYQVISRLVSLGAEPHAIFRELYERASLARIQLAGRVLGRVTLACDGQLAYTYASWADFTELSALPSDSEDLVNECLKISGTKAAFIGIEQSSRLVKISFRSRTAEVDVASIAEKYGGGGHRLAAGATLPGPLTQAVESALAAMSASINAIPR